VKKRNVQIEAATRITELLESSPPKDFVGLRGGEWGVPRSMLDQYRALDDLGGKTE
jgi:hypothetical protein